MRPALIQSSFKFNMLDSSKLSLVRFYSTKRNVESSQKNHYDTLKITPHATQNEVKSAYYKLTLQYHPDKNKTEYAKQKFQDVSEAYEVLSNLELRKNYDRNIIIHQSPVSTTVQEPTSRYKDNVYSGTSKIYNFDAWTHAHYGEQMRAQHKRRQQYERYKEMEEVDTGQKTSRFTEISLFLFTIIVFAIICREKPDALKSKTEEHIGKNNKN